MDKIKLHNGVEIPKIGFGTYKSQDGPETISAVKNAILAGYRLIDGASVYQNEKSVGQGIKESGIPREELFITSKLWNDDKGYEETKTAFYKTLQDLDLEYLDLYLIHWPIAKKSRSFWEQANNDTWRAMEELYKEGKIKAIGVSNFFPHHLEALMKEATIMPMVNQIEFHPGVYQKEVLDFCKEHNIVVEAWAPLAKGSVFTDPVMLYLSEKYNASISKITLNWIMEKGVIPLPKSVTKERIISNFDTSGIKLQKEDIEKIDAIVGYAGSGTRPDNIDY